MRPGDFPARYGGEEFAVILPNTDEEGALQVAQNIRKTIHSLSILHEKSQVSEYVSLSLGITTIIPTKENSHKDLIAQADEALYASKNQGRNRVMSFKDARPLSERL